MPWQRLVYANDSQSQSSPASVLRGKGRRLNRTARRGALVAASAIAVWQAAAAAGAVNAFLLPSPLRVAEAALDLLGDGTLPLHVGISLGRVLAGFGFATLLAVPLAILLCLRPRLIRPVLPLIDLFRHIPPLAMIPLFILWLGIGETQKVAVILLAAFFPVFLATQGGISQVDRRLLEVAQVAGMTEAAQVWRILLPAALPSILVGLRLGFGYSWRALAGAELVAASSGLGWLIVNAEQLARSDIVLAGVLVIGMLGLILDALGTRLIVRLAPWAQAEITRAHA